MLSSGTQMPAQPSPTPALSGFALFSQSEQWNGEDGQRWEDGKVIGEPW